MVSSRVVNVILAGCVLKGTNSRPVDGAVLTNLFEASNSGSG